MFIAKKKENNSKENGFNTNNKMKVLYITGQSNYNINMSLQLTRNITILPDNNNYLFEMKLALMFLF